MATVIEFGSVGMTLVIARLLAILAVNHGTGGDLSVSGQVAFGDHPHPDIQGAVPFLAVSEPDLAIEIGAPLNQYTYTLRMELEGWAPTTVGDTVIARYVAAAALLNHVVGAIQDDFAADTGSNTLFDLLEAVPAFEDVKIHGLSVRNGANYGRFTFTLVAVYRKTSGV